MSKLGRVVSLVLTLIMNAWVCPHANAGMFIRWEPAQDKLPISENNGIKEVSCGGNPAFVYVIVEGMGLFKSEDFGKTWARIEGDAECLKDPFAVAVSPADGKIVFAASAAPGSGLWKSVDAGTTWVKCADSKSGMASDDIEWIAFSPQTPTLMLVGHRTGREISISSDGGNTWQTSNLGADIKAQLPIILDDAKWVVASRAQNGIWCTDDGGKTWVRGLEKEKTVEYFRGPLPVVAAGDCLLASRHHGWVRSVDAGRTWAYRMERHTRVVGSCGKLIFIEDRTEFAPDNSRELTLRVTDDGAGTWQNATFNLLAQVPKERRKFVRIEGAVDMFAHVRIATAWSAAPDGKTVFLGLGKAGLYRGVIVTNMPGGPLMGGATVSPPVVAEGDTRIVVTVKVAVSSKFGDLKLKKVAADLGAIGKGELLLYDDGQHNDGAAGDNVYANTFQIAEGTLAGTSIIGLYAEDEQGRTSATTTSFKISSLDERKIIWNGEEISHGKGWMKAGPFNYFKPQTESAKSGNCALEMHGDGPAWIGGGWNWHGWWPDNAGTDISLFRNLSFWLKVEGGDPGAVEVSLNCSGSKKPTGTVSISNYCAEFADGQWHEIVIPLVDLYAAAKEQGFNPKRAWEFNISSWSPNARKFSLYIDDIGFDNRPVRPHSQLVREPEPRDAPKLATDAAMVKAEVDIKAAGMDISPWIYGVAMGDINICKEMGITIRRLGGNQVTPTSWKTGFSAKGSDWFYANNGEQTPPENNWMATFHKANKKNGFETYQTIPMMGRVAKDGTSVAFDINKYPDQTDWAGKHQPQDRHANAGNGIQYIKNEKGEYELDEKGNKKTRLIEPDPNDTSVEMSPEEQTEMLRFMVEKMGYGTADKGGIKYIALDNEPMLWNSTHRGMHPNPVSYDELWERTKTYASLYLNIDPDVKIACGTFWGWTAYLYSALDAQMCNQGKAKWESPPDYEAHGKEFLTRWLLKKLAEYEKETGKRLCHILDWHFYPQTGIYRGGKPNDPKVMEGRVEETRVLWDPEFKEPSWMGNEVGKIIRLIPRMKEWVAECYPGTKIALGEYCFGGEGDISGGIAQAEILGIFAREGLDFGFYWFSPPPNSSPYFAFKMFRNPDGKKTAFGDRYLPVKVSAPLEISVHAAKDTKTEKLTFVLINKRVAKDAWVNLKLNADIPAQDIIAYEYSLRDRYAIGQLPPQKFTGGDTIEVALPAFSVLRFDLNAK